jgi:outer membrane lipoprotein-sorting protein
MLAITVSGQNARHILDATAGKIKQMGNVKATFTATTFNGTVEQATTKGTMLLQGKKMQLSTDEMKMWYNGKTQWSLIPGSDEVNVFTPTEREIANMNPYSFLGFYKKGYKMKAKQTKLRGKDAYEIHLVARYAGSNAQEMYIDVSKNDYTPLCIRIRQDNDWNRISIHSIQGNQHFTDSDFEFPKNEYPNVEIINLR